MLSICSSEEYVLWLVFDVYNCLIKGRYTSPAKIKKRQNE